MKPLTLIVAAIGVAIAAGYAAIHTWAWGWWAVVAIAVVVALAAWCWWIWPRYAALHAAIAILAIRELHWGAFSLFVKFKIHDTADVNIEAKAAAPETAGYVIGAGMLLAYQAVLETLIRLPKLEIKNVLSKNFWVSGTRSPAAINSPSSTVVAGDVTASPGTQVAIGSNITQMQVSADLGSDVEFAATALTEGRIRSAEQTLRSLKSKYMPALTRSQRARVLANIALIETMKGRIDVATENFELSIAEEDDEAKVAVRRAYIEYISGQAEAALRRMKDLLEKSPANTDAASLRIICDKSAASVHGIRQSLSRDIQDDLHVLIACCSRENDANRFSEAERIAKEGLKRYPADPDLTDILASALVAACEVKHGQSRVPSSLVEAEKVDLRSALDLLTAILKNRQIEWLDNRVANVYSRRGLAKYFLGDIDGAIADWQEMHLRSQSDDESVIPLAVKLFDSSRANEAIRLLTASLSVRSSLSVATLLSDLAKLNGVSDQSVDWVAAVEEAMRQDGREDPVAVLRAAIALTDRNPSLTQMRVDRAVSYVIELANGRLGDLGIYLCKAGVYLAFDQLGDASWALDMALLVVDTGRDEREFVELAIMLRKCGRKMAAANLLLRQISATEDREKIRVLVEFSGEVGMDGAVVALSQQMRRKGKWLEWLAVREVSLLVKYFRTDEVVQVIADAEGNGCGVEILNWMRYALSVAAVTIGKLNLVEKNPDRLPRASELPTRELANFSKVMRYGPGREYGLFELYDILRLNVGAAEPAMAYVALWRLVDDFDAGESPTVIEDGVAFQVEDEEGRVEWRIVGSKANGDSRFIEYASDSPSVLPFLGKSVGDRVAQVSRFDTSVFHVKAIIDKKEWMFLSILQLFPKQHPDSNFLMRFTIPYSVNGKLDFRVLGVQLNHWQEMRQRPFEFYRTHSVPMSVLANVAGMSVIAAWQAVALNPDLPIRVTSGNAEELREVGRVLELERAYVLESSAAATLFNTGCWKELRGSGMRILVSAGLLNEIWSSIADSLFRRDGQVQVGTVGDIPIPVVRDEESWAREQWRYGQFYLWLRDECEVIDGGDLCEMRPSQRDQLIQLFGMSVAMAIASAANRGLPLWCDDYMTAAFARSLGVSSRIWTWVVLAECERRGEMSRESWMQVQATLIAADYSFVILTPDCFMEAGRRCRFDVRNTIMNGLCRWFSLNPIKIVVSVAVAADVLRAVYSARLLADQEQAVVDAIVSCLSKRNDGAIAVSGLASLADQIYPFEIVHQESLKQVCGRWEGVAIAEVSRRMEIRASESGGRDERSGH